MPSTAMPRRVRSSASCASSTGSPGKYARSHLVSIFIDWFYLRKLARYAQWRVRKLAESRLLIRFRTPSNPLINFATSVPSPASLRMTARREIQIACQFDLRLQFVKRSARCSKQLAQLQVGQPSMPFCNMAGTSRPPIAAAAYAVRTSRDLGNSSVRA